MNLRNGIALVLGVLFTLLSIESSAQEQVYNAFIKDSLGVGENLDFYISIEQADLPSVSQIDLSAIEEMEFYPPALSEGDSIVSKKADISINDWGLWEDKDNNGFLENDEIKWEKVQNGDTILYRNKVNISFFDVGLYIFDGLPIVINGRNILTNKDMVKVNFIEYDLEVIDSTGMAPIKDIQRENLTIFDILPYVLYALIPILLFLGYRQYKRYQDSKMAEPIIEEEVIISPDVLALGNLKTLKERKLWQAGKIKEYQSELSRIIREYLEGRYDIKALENTTSQIIRSIKDTSFDTEDQNKLKRILQISDLVKFAKAKPEVNIHEEFMNDAISFVQKTRQQFVEDKSEEE